MRNTPKQITEHFILISINSYESKNPSGRVWRACQSGGQEFGSLMQLILMVEDLIDSPEGAVQGAAGQGFTQLGAVRAAGSLGGDASDTAPGTLATFKLKILFRQNNSWQGTLRWVEGRQERCFRSVLELVKQLDQILARTEELGIAQIG